jgi:hypothetical protein
MDLSTYPRQDLFDTTLVSDIGSGDTSIVLNTAPSFTLSSGSLYVHVDFDDDTKYEPMLVTAITSATLTVTRGIAKYEGGGSTATSHAAGAKVRFSIGWKDFDNIRVAIASKLDESGGIALTPITDAVYASLAALQAAFPAPSNGMSAYCTLEGKAYDAIGGAWTAREAGGTFPNATTTVAGKVEKATSAESIAGTDTGGTGASLFASPADISANLQNSAHIYAATSTGNDDYAITVSPAVAAYATGQRFVFKADVANTGAATLAVSGLAAKTIKKLHDQDLENNDIEIGSIVDVVYDGTNFQMQTPCATNMSSANAALLTGGTNITIHKHGKFMTTGSADFSGGVPSATNIAHGLGVAPALVSITAYLASSSGSNSTLGMSRGSYDGTNNKCVSGLISIIPSSAAETASYIIKCTGLFSAAWHYGYATATVDATNITLTWGRSNAAFNGVIYYEVEAWV